LSAVDNNGQSQIVFVDKSYNPLGQLETVSRPYFAGATPVLTRSYYDLAGRVYRVETPKEGGVAVAVNLFHGLSVDSINPLQYEQANGDLAAALRITTTKDSQGHLVQATDAKHGTITYRQRRFWTGYR